MGTREDCGILLYLRLPKPLAAATLSYRVRFSSGYGWTLGGKLPGEFKAPALSTPASGATRTCKLLVGASFRVAYIRMHVRLLRRRRA